MYSVDEGPGSAEKIEVIIHTAFIMLLNSVYNNWQALLNYYWMHRANASYLHPHYEELIDS